MSTNDIKHLAVETIYLVPDSSEGQRCYLWCDDPAPGMGMDPSEAVEYLRKDVHDAIIAKQAKAAKQGMDAAKKVAGSELEQAKRLSAECSPEALESERAANALLTERIAELEAHTIKVAAAVGNSAYPFNASIQAHCIENMKRFAEHLHAIEREFFMVPGEPDEDYPDAEPDDECLVNCWGSTTEQYVEQFRAALVRREALKEAEALEEAAGEAVPAMHQMAHWLLARAADKRKQVEAQQ